MDEVTKGGFRLTLCWNCAHATHPDVCPWVERFEPVPGWKAEKTYLMQDTPSPYESYLVVECPLFERDGYFGGMKKAKDAPPELSDDEVRRVLETADWLAIEAYAKNGMSATRAARTTHYDRRTISARLSRIFVKTGIDPRSFDGLCRLLRIKPKEGRADSGVSDS